LSLWYKPDHNIFYLKIIQQQLLVKNQHNNHHHIKYETVVLKYSIINLVESYFYGLQLANFTLEIRQLANILWQNKNLLANFTLEIRQIGEFHTRDSPHWRISH